MENYQIIKAHTCYLYRRHVSNIVLYQSTFFGKSTSNFHNIQKIPLYITLKVIHLYKGILGIVYLVYSIEYIKYTIFREYIS